MQNWQSSHQRRESLCFILLACMLDTSSSTGGGVQKDLSDCEWISSQILNVLDLPVP